METGLDIEAKYQKLATEYSKIRSHAMVLKKAVLDEQSKILELKEVIKEQEQKIRKHDQEMDSLTFRNEQLTKRITVLQQELQTNSRGKKSKNKSLDNAPLANFSVLDEELHKKILENAELVSTIADKDLEILSSREKIEWLDRKNSELQKEIEDLKNKHTQELQCQLELSQVDVSKSSEFPESSITVQECKKYTGRVDLQTELNSARAEAERWKAECELLKSKPESDCDIAQFYESQLESLFETKQFAESETRSLWADNEALICRLEKLVLEKNALDRIVEKSKEELYTTTENYKSQLDAMTEHLAAQNEKITQQSDEIEYLKHSISLKK